LELDLFRPAGVTGKRTGKRRDENTSIEQKERKKWGL
jgi:hypothetical protein